VHSLPPDDQKLFAKPAHATVPAASCWFIRLRENAMQLPAATEAVLKTNCLTQLKHCATQNQSFDAQRNARTLRHLKVRHPKSEFFANC
jgi:hypothetical protein